MIKNTNNLEDLVDEKLPILKLNIRNKDIQEFMCITSKNINEILKS